MAADLRHAPIALVERGTPVLVVAVRGATAADVASMLRVLRRRGARTFAVTDDERVASLAQDAVLVDAHVPEAVAPIALVVVAQHLAAELARVRGLDPDRPARLSKVTRTR